MVRRRREGSARSPPPGSSESCPTTGATVWRRYPRACFSRRALVPASGHLTADGERVTGNERQMSGGGGGGATVVRRGRRRRLSSPHLIPVSLHHRVMIASHFPHPLAPALNSIPSASSPQSVLHLLSARKQLFPCLFSPCCSSLLMQRAPLLLQLFLLLLQLF